MIDEHLPRVIQQLKFGNSIGRRGTPVVSFWPMRVKWEQHGGYWEQYGTDGDTFIKDGDLWGPGELQLIYFRIPGNMVCQLAYLLHEEGLDTVERAARRLDAVEYNLRMARRGTFSKAP